MTNKQFKRLLEKYQAGNCTPEEEKLIQQWYQSFEQEEDGIQPLSQDQTEALEEKMMRKIRNQKQASSRRKITPLVSYATLSVAAFLLICLGYFSWSWLQTIYEERQQLTVESGNQIRKVILPDGSLVWLKANSLLTYPSQFNKKPHERSVRLQGEALFEVVKNPQQPFLIACGNIEAKVLGTSFNIKQLTSKQQVEVAVLTGKVAITDKEREATGAQSVVVEPMQLAISGPQGFSKLPVQSLSNYIQGTAYDMRFDDTPLQEVVDRIEQKFDIQITYSEVAEDCRISADFTDQSLGITLRMLVSLLSEGKYQIKGNKVFIQGASCQ